MKSKNPSFPRIELTRKWSHVQVPTNMKHIYRWYHHRPRLRLASIDLLEIMRGRVLLRDRRSFVETGKMIEKGDPCRASVINTSKLHCCETDMRFISRARSFELILIDTKVRYRTRLILTLIIYISHFFVCLLFDSSFRRSSTEYTRI